jgi:predicted Co/Zn/Cd cation transporter (cation efflux family)
LIGLVSSLLAVVISRESKRKTKLYPDGVYFLEPLYAILKSLLTLSLLVVSVVVTSVAAYQYFAHGTGNVMNIAPVLPYTISMVILCFGVGFFNKKQNKKINNISTILTAESKSNFVDGLQSFGIGIAIVFLNMIDYDSTLGFLHYTGDFFVTVILALISLKQPIIVLINSFRELTGGASNDTEIKSKIERVVAVHLDGITQDKRCEIFKIGMHIKVRISLLNEVNQDTVAALVKVKQTVLEEMKKTYDSVELSYVF